jgi:L-ascorbate metabolism protein UlaG (beta-lactamase superfamily)
MDTVAITRVVNAIVLLELPGGTILTDPYFKPVRFLPLREQVGLRTTELPRLTAIVGGHGVLDHWQLHPLRGYPYRDTTPVLVATAAMARGHAASRPSEPRLRRTGSMSRCCPSTGPGCLAVAW